jgi:hypothetical protein
MSEQAIYMVNSFQFTRSTRLILAYRPSGSGKTRERFLEDVPRRRGVFAAAGLIPNGRRRL